MLLSTPLTVADINYFDSHTRDMYGTSHSDWTYLLSKTLSMDKLVQYFHTPYSNKDIDLVEGVYLAIFKVHLFSSSVEYCNIPNVKSYKSSCNQCSPIAAYTMYYIDLARAKSEAPINKFII